MTNSPAREIAFDLLRRLLAGERGQIPMLLAMLLEKSSSLADGDDHYRKILPPEFADLRLSQQTSGEILTELCGEVARNPDEAFISAISFAGSDLATKTVAMLLADPPRPLTTSEYSYALSLASKSLPYNLEEDPEFLSQADLERIVQTTKQLQNIEEGESDGSLRVQIRHQAGNLLKSLADRGIV